VTTLAAGSFNAGSLTVGGASILQTLTFTNGTGSAVTSTYGYFSSTVSTTQLFANNGVFGGLVASGTTVCLSNGVGCQAGVAGGADLNWAYDPANDFVRNNTSTTDLLLGIAATSLSSGAPAYFDLSGSVLGTSTFFFGFATNVNVAIGLSSVTSTGISSALFVMDGRDLAVGGSIGSVSSVYTNGAFVSGGSSFYGDGFINDTNSSITITATGGISLGGSVTSTDQFYGNMVTSTSLFANGATFGGLVVSGTTVCLSSGTGCQAVAAGGNDLNWTFNAANGGFVYNATATTDIFLGNTASSTGAAVYFDLAGGTVGTSTLFLGYGTNTNVVIGGTSTTQTGLSALFVMNGDDLFVEGSIGSVSSVFTNGVFAAGATVYGSSTISNSNATLTISSVTATQVIGTLYNKFTSTTRAVQIANVDLRSLAGRRSCLTRPASCASLT
jgi:hypothetical protein